MSPYVRLTRRRARIAAAGVAVALVLAGACWVAGLGWQTRDHLLAAAGLARQLHAQVEAGEASQARQTLASLQERTRAARDRTTTPGWRLGQTPPLLGGNLSAIGTVAAAMDDLAHEGLPPLVEVADELDPARLAPRNGRVDLASLQQAAPEIATADRSVREARDRVAAIPTGSLLPPVRSAVTQLAQDLDRAARTTGMAARTAALMPPMLGVESPRTYLLLFQTNAEIRATGGMPGAYAVVEADRGALRIAEQGTAAADIGVFDDPVLPLDPGMRALYTDRLGTYQANVNLTPHFPTAAALAREMYRLRSGRTVDGVLATDPVALSYLLRATGPVPIPDATPLTADNAVRTLLSDVYAELETNAEQDEFFADAAAATFDAVVGNGTDPRAAVDELARAAGERRLLLWSAHPAEQELIAGTVLAGELPADDGHRPAVGVFLNDGTGGKLSYYLTQEVRLAAGQCWADGRRELQLEVSLGSTAPDRGLSPFVVGLGLAGDPYTVRTNVSIFSPTGGALVEVRVDGEPVPVGSGTERGRAVGILTVDLPPGSQRTIEATVLTGVHPTDAELAADLWLTPAATPWVRNSVPPLVCPISE